MLFTCENIKRFGCSFLKRTMAENRAQSMLGCGSAQFSPTVPPPCIYMSTLISGNDADISSLEVPAGVASNVRSLSFCRVVARIWHAS